MRNRSVEIAINSRLFNRRASTGDCMNLEKETGNVRHFGYLMIALAVAVPMLAAGETASVPEINAGSVSAAVAVVSGGLVVLRARKKK